MIVQSVGRTVKRFSICLFSKFHLLTTNQYLSLRKISTNTYDKLKLSGLIKSSFPDNVDLNAVLSKKQTIYAGFDPTASSLHVGNLLVLVALLKLHGQGHRIIVLIGNATAQIGDPSGKFSERPFLEKSTIEQNATGIFNDVSKIRKKVLGKTKRDSFRIFFNNDWYKEMNPIDFINYGRMLRMGALLSKNSVRERLNSSQGLSFSEFSYQLFQAYDWFHLFKNFDCRIQLGGVDQIINIHNGHDLIKKSTNDHSTFGIFMPLITDEKGRKIGKSDSGKAVYLNPEMTSHYGFYQYFIRLRDSDIIPLLKMFSFKPEIEIEQMIQKQLRNRKPWYLQRKLAEEMTTFIHGEDGLENAKRISEAFFSKDLEALGDFSEQEMNDVFDGVEKFNLEFLPGQTNVLDIAMRTNCFDYINDAMNTIQEGGFHLNFIKICDPNQIIDEEFILRNHHTIVGYGKRNYRLIHWL